MLAHEMPLTFSFQRQLPACARWSISAEVTCEAIARRTCLNSIAVLVNIWWLSRYRRVREVGLVVWWYMEVGKQPNSNVVSVNDAVTIDLTAHD
jgi:hypothetical protein